MGGSDTHGWVLAGPDGQVYGRLTAPSVDMFDTFCGFEPSPAFAALVPLFAEELRLLDGIGGEGGYEAWEAAQSRVAALGLELRPPGGGAPIRAFILHVDLGARQAWFRS